MSAMAAATPHDVLHVEDDDDYVFLFKEYLEGGSAEVRVTAVGDGHAALALLAAIAADPARRLPRLILLDINMPRMNGFEFLEGIKAHPRLAGIPVVMLTASNRDEDRRRSAALGAAGYICKEQPLRELAGAVLRHLPAAG